MILEHNTKHSINLNIYYHFYYFSLLLESFSFCNCYICPWMPFHKYNYHQFFIYFIFVNSTNKLLKEKWSKNTISNTLHRINIKLRYPFLFCYYFFATPTFVQSDPSHIIGRCRLQCVDRLCSNSNTLIKFTLIAAWCMNIKLIKE
jgi:hypothetical protein